MLNIKPILEMRDGGIEPVVQVRTQRRAVDCLLELTRERLKAPQPIRLVVLHSNVPDAARDLLDRAMREFNGDESYIAELSPVIGTHVGPGTLALACMSGM
jgi:fatty acid-binding protein DegV